MNENIKVVVDLGHCLARLQGKNQNVELVICSPGESAEFFTPSEAIHLYGTEDVKKLRDFLNKHLPEEQT